jgi:chemotaxis protein methyltransferase CheR
MEIRHLLEALYSRYSYDFRHYTPASMKRRVGQAAQALGLQSVPHLEDVLVKSPDRFLEALQYLTIPVSEMFRDATYFISLRERVFPVLQTYPSLKVWIAGCSTGEETYSLAIMLHEAGLLERSTLYATDINPTSLASAARGIFKIVSMRKFTENYQKAGGKRSLSDYYSSDKDLAILDSSLRRNVTFADHSLATDAVFGETQFISCRNVLIYFDRELQDRAIGLFRDSLSRRGFLGLGSKETVEFSKHAHHFAPLVKADRIFQRTS